MKKKIAILLTAVLILTVTAILLPSCKGNSDTVAKVKGIEITQSDVDVLKERAKVMIKMEPEQKEMTDEEIVDELIKQNVIMLECEKLGCSVTNEDIEKYIEEQLDIIKDDADTMQYFDDYAKLVGMKDAQEYMRSDVYKETVRYVLSSERVYLNYVDNVTDKTDGKAIKEEYQQYLSQLIDSYNAKKY